MSYLSHLALPHAGRGHGGGTDPEPAGDERRPRVARDLVLVEGDPGPVECLLSCLSRQVRVEGAKVHQHQVVVSAARDYSETFGGQSRG